MEKLTAYTIDCLVNFDKMTGKQSGWKKNSWALSGSEWTVLHGKQTQMFGTTVFWSNRLRHSFLTNILSSGGNVSECLHNMFVCESKCVCMRMWVCACISNGLFWLKFLRKVGLFLVKLSWTWELCSLFWWLCVHVCVIHTLHCSHSLTDTSIFYFFQLCCQKSKSEEFTSLFMCPPQFKENIAHCCEARNKWLLT